MNSMFKSIAVILVMFLASISTTTVSAEQAEDWGEESIYFLIIDRFNNGDPKNDRDYDPKKENGYIGGDFIGIQSQFDYVQKLGYTAIGLSPIYATNYKGYSNNNVSSYYELDPHFGTKKELQNLVENAHERGLKVILDVPQIEATVEEEIELLRYWISETNIDGLRFYDIEETTLTEWKELIENINRHREIFILGESSDTLSLEEQNQYKEAGFNSIFNRSFQEAITSTLNKSDQSLQSLFDVQQRIADESKLDAIFMDSRETDRFVRYSLDVRYYPEKPLKLALAATFTSPGIVATYYGTEIGLDGKAGLDNQKVMNFQTEEEIVKHIEKLQQLRKQYRALALGEMEVLHEKDGFGVVKRTYEDETFIVTLNNTSKDQKILLTNEQLEGGKELRGLFEDDLVRSTEEGYMLVSNRETANVYVLAPKTSINMSFISILVLINVAFISFLFYVWKNGKRRENIH